VNEEEEQDDSGEENDEEETKGDPSVATTSQKLKQTLQEEN